MERNLFNFKNEKAKKEFAVTIIGVIVLVIGIVLRTSYYSKYHELYQQISGRSSYTYVVDGQEKTIKIEQYYLKNGKKWYMHSLMCEIWGFNKTNLGEASIYILIIPGMLAMIIGYVKFSADNIEPEQLRQRELQKKKLQMQKEEIANKQHLAELYQEKMAAVESQKYGNAWSKKYFTDPCPYCGHYKVRYATWDDKKTSVAFWGIWSSKVGKAFICDYCNRVFNN